MLVARANHNEMRPIAVFAERVQLALGTENNQPTPEGYVAWIAMFVSIQASS
jgi:hypothetical protein